jgi:hypothetical protein
VTRSHPQRIQGSFRSLAQLNQNLHKRIVLNIKEKRAEQIEGFSFEITIMEVLVNYVLNRFLLNLLMLSTLLHCQKLSEPSISFAQLQELLNCQELNYDGDRVST